MKHELICAGVPLQENGGVKNRFIIYKQDDNVVWMHSIRDIASLRDGSEIIINGIKFEIGPFKATDVFRAMITGDRICK